MDCLIPAKISAGLTFSRLLTLPAYPAGEWALSLLMRGAQSRAVLATPEGIQHRLAATAASTKGWLGGAYDYSLRASRGDDVQEVERGTLVVEADMAELGDGHDARSHARKVLDSINAVIERRATMDQSRYVINNRELQRTPIGELLMLRDKYAAMVRREQYTASGRSLWGPAVRVTF